MLDALYRGWKEDTEAGRTSLMIAGDLGSVSELNGRARAERIAAGEVEERGLDVAGGGTAGVGDKVVTRQNDRRLGTGPKLGPQRRPVDRHCHPRRRLHDGPAGQGHREGGAPGRLRERARRARLRLDGAPGPGPHRRHRARHGLSDHHPRGPLRLGHQGKGAQPALRGHPLRPRPADLARRDDRTGDGRQVLAGVLRNEGADVAAHEMIRRHQHEAEGMERLSAEYLTLATLAQAERWDALLVRSGLTDAELECVRASEAHGPLLASLREAEARGLDVEAAFPQLVARRSLADAADVAAVLHGRVDRWTQAAGGRRRMAENLIAGLIPRAQGVTDPEMAEALAERDAAMQERALHRGRPSDRSRSRLGATTREPAVRSFPTGRLGS